MQGGFTIAMKETVNSSVRTILTNYLEQSNHRKTPERYAVLDTVYRFDRSFSIPELSEQLDKAKFHVSRATIYNTLKLLLKLRLVVCHRLEDGVKYEASYGTENHCHQVCTVCGKVAEISVPNIVREVNNTHLRRFRKDGFSLYIYGICSTCQAKITRKRNKNNANIK